VNYHAAPAADHDHAFGVWWNRASSRWARFGFFEMRGGGAWLATYHFVGLPHWLPLLLVTLPAAAAELRSRARRRRGGRAGLCPRCGYDLRATPDRCPECGAVPAVKGAA
jgi:hypothetical protein